MKTEVRAPDRRAQDPPFCKDAISCPGLLALRELIEENGAHQGRTEDLLRLCEAKGLEPQLAHCQRMASMGLLIAGISHDLKNILARLALCSELSELQVGGEAGPGAILRRGIQQGLALSDILLSFSRRREDRCEPTDLARLLEEVLRLVATELGLQGIRIERAIREVGLVDVNPGLLQNMFLNLLLNAKEAMPQGGVLKLSLDQDDAGVRLLIADSGAGMNRETLTHVFEPFFTTKRFLGDGRTGTGLGLYMSSQIVRRHGGLLTCDSVPGEGTTFTVRLPLSIPPAESRPGSGPAVPGQAPAEAAAGPPTESSSAAPADAPRRPTHADSRPEQDTRSGG